ncbi:geranylgeranyl transferase type-2 subunit beta [Enteropsectra breve]|nr:geranylgeranyl transferase type-2 subunit beta [Enteropsectra breve]
MEMEEKLAVCHKCSEEQAHAKLNKERHIKYILEMIEKKDILFYLTEPCRLATLYWAANSLKILTGDGHLAIKEKALKVLRESYNSDGGFGGNSGYPSSMITTFQALQILFIYDIAFPIENTVSFIISQQRPDGSFTNDDFLEKDTRFDCCAILSLKILEEMQEKSHSERNKTSELLFFENMSFSAEDLKAPISPAFLEDSGFNLQKSISHILSCYNPNGGFGQIPGAESHAAQIFCCISALRTLGQLDIIDTSQIASFLAFRQCASGGINGRINKKEDVCYSFWAYASAVMIGASSYSPGSLRTYIFNCEAETGGFSDRPGNMSDLYHLMFSLASLSLMGEESLGRIDPGFAL